MNLKLLCTSLFMLAVAPVSQALAGVGGHKVVVECKVTPNKDGHCTGTLAGFRSSPDATAQVAFRFMPSSTETKGEFTATFKGQKYSCSTNDPKVLAGFAVPLQPHSVFFVGWHGDTCNFMSVSSESYSQ